MKFKFFLGLFGAIVFGLAFGQSLVSISEASHEFAINNFSKINNLPQLITESSSSLVFWNHDKELGGDSLASNSTKTEIGTTTETSNTTENLISFNQKGSYSTKKGAKFPKITSKAYMVADLDSGNVITSYAEKVPYPIASLSKMMTALVSLETVNQYKETKVSKTAYGTYGDQGSLRAGEKIKTSDLLYPLLLESSNDAAEVLAEFAGRNTFIKNMNDKAASIGLFNTKFEDPSGLSKNNVSTAEDLFKLASYIFKYKSYIFEITKLRDFTNEKHTHTWYSNSRFRNDENYLGGKNGYTDEANHTLVTMVELPLGEFQKRKIAIVLLNSEKTEPDARAIILYLLKNVYYTE